MTTQLDQNSMPRSLGAQLRDYQMPHRLSVALAVVWTFVTGLIIVLLALQLGVTGFPQSTGFLGLTMLIGLPVNLFLAWLSRPEGSNHILGDR